MGWIIFILQLISTLPGLIKAVREIIGLIKALPKDERKEAKAKMVALAKKAKSGKNPVASESEINQYLDELRQRVGRAPKV